jgi:hypothetical protein
MSFTTKQKENISKYLFDVSKLSFGGLVIGRLIGGNGVVSWVLYAGVIFSTLTFIVAVLLDKGGVSHD